MSPASKRRQLLGLSSLVLGCWLLAIPAQAGLGDLIDEVVDEVAELPVVTTIPVTLPPVTVPEVIPPVEVNLPTVSTPEIVLPVGDGIEIGPIVITPPIVEVEPGGTIGVDPEVPPVVIGDDVPSTIETPLVTTTSQPISRPPVLSPPPIDERSVAIDPPADRSVELRILQTIVASQVLTGQVLTGAEPAPLASRTAPASTGNSWLDSLADWLSIESLSQLLAIPFRLLSLLFRALMSAGSGLVAPASLLLTLAVGARGRLRPAAA